MQDIHGFAQLLSRNNKRDVGFFRTLRKSDHTDTISTQCTKKFTRNTWHIAHIVSNPPYEPDALRETLPAEFTHEPDNALFSGEDGMDVIRKLLEQAAEKLKPSGLLLIEVGGLQDALEAAFPQIEFNWLATADESDCVCLIQASSLKRAFGK